MRISWWGSRRSRATALAAVAGVLAVNGLLVPAPAAPTSINPVLAAVDEAIGPVDPVAEALSFGVMTEGNATVNNDENEGTLAVGGDLTFGTYQLAGATAGSFVVPGDANPSALVVGGRVNFAGSVGGSRLQVLSNGYAKVGDLSGTFVRNTDNNGAQVNTRILPANDYDASPRVELVTRQPVASVGPTSPINFAGAFAAFRDTTAGLATCDNTVVLRTPNGDVLPRPIPPGSNAVVTLTPGVTNVLNLTAADLANIQILTFASQPSANTPLLVNVDTSGVGNTFAWTAPNFAGIGGPQARYILFNFPTATALTLTPNAATVEGTIYAPNASLTDLSSSNTEGSVITRTLDHRGGEIHYFPFSTTLSCEGATPADIALIKSSTTTLITSVGQQVPYSFHVVNTGGVPLTNISVTDVQTPPSSNANLGPITCAATALAPGAQTACTATYTVTQADLDNNGVTNVATAQGNPPTGPPVVSDPNSLTIPAQQLTAAVTVVKSSTTTSITSVGQQVPYRFLVANTGGLTLSNVAVTDAQTPPSSNANLGPITCPVTTLAPGASTTCTATYTVTQADLDNDGVTNVATARGTPTGGGTPVTSPPSTLTIPEAGLIASIAIMKTSTTTSITTVGQQVPYQFHVLNTGGFTLTGVNVTDVQTPPSSNANLGPITCAATTLAPGAQTLCTATYTVTQADLDNDGVTNVATAHGTPPGGTPVDSTPATLTIPETGLVASIAILKTSTTTSITTVGQQVPYQFHVVNTGGLTLSNVAVTDAQTPPSSNANLGPITCAATTVAPGAQTLCTATYTVTQADLDFGSVRDSATAQGTPPGGRPPVQSPPATLTIPSDVVIPGISLVKSSTTTSITAVGQQVPYRFLVANTGGVTLNGVNVTDVQTPPSSNADLGPITCAATTLAPGANTTCTATYTVTQADLDNDEVTDVATAHGTPAGSDDPIDSAPSTLTIPAADLIRSISLLKSSTTVSINTVGQQVPYRFLVANTGTVTLSSVNVTDVQTPPSSNADLGPITCAATTLAPGANTTCTATYTVTQADLDNNGVTDVATAHGTPAGSETPIDSPPATLTIPDAGIVASIQVVKTSTTVLINAVGQQVPYRFHVVNNGGLTLTNVNVTDVQTPPSSNADLGPITCAATTLAPGASTTCTATYTVTQADLDNNGVTDVATAHGTPPGGGAPVDSPPSTLTIPESGLVANIEVIKSTTTVAIAAPGQQVPYTFLVVNSGGFTLTDVTVNDTVLPPSERGVLGPITCGPQNIPNGAVTLSPGASIQCRTTYTVTAEDFTGSSLRNVATATGTPPFGPPPVSPPSPVDIPIPHPAIAITKSVTPTVVSAAGDVVTYRFVVSNTGTTPLSAVTVDETDFSGTGTPGAITCGAVTLALGASTTCTSTYAVTAADIQAGRITNTAVAAGTPPTIPGQEPPAPVRSAPASAEVTATRGAAITVVKSSSTDRIVRPGQHVPFQFVVTNTGQVPLTDVTITDALTAPASAANLGPITCGPERTPNGAVTLAAGAAVTCAATYTVSKADYHHGSLRNTATATGTPPDGPAPVSPESTIAIPVKGKLPVTGTSFPAGLWMGAGVLAVLLGAALLLVVRQRRIRA